MKVAPEICNENQIQIDSSPPNGVCGPRCCSMQLMVGENLRSACNGFKCSIGEYAVTIGTGKECRCQSVCPSTNTFASIDAGNCRCAPAVNRTAYLT